jgi:hypothetical protein
MRAYTSLLGHILGSHPDINGYYEMHLGYESNKDLEQQLKQYAGQEALKPGSRFLFDKLLHNAYALELDQLTLGGEAILLSLRQPEQTIKSVLSLFANKMVNDPYSNPDEATRYYVERLTWLADFCEKYSQRYYYFDAELIPSDTQRILAALSHWLRLAPELSDRYQRFSKTGVARAGDSSRAIISGKVISKKHNYSNISLDAKLARQALHVYQTSRRRIIGQAIACVTE